VDREERSCAGVGESCEETTCCPGSGCIEGVCIDECVPITCEELGIECGDHSDGCGATLACGECADGNVCDSGICVPKKEQQIDEACIRVSECASGAICTEELCTVPPSDCRGFGVACDEVECCGGLFCNADNVCSEMTPQCAGDGEDCTDHPCCSKMNTCSPSEAGHRCTPVDDRSETGQGGGGGGNSGGGGDSGGNNKNNGGGGKKDGKGNNGNNGNNGNDGNDDAAGATCLHVGGKPGPGERCCDRLHLEKGRCVINRWDHCDQGTRGQGSGCERGTTCEGRRISPHQQEVCVPRRHRRRVRMAGL
jgi:hypothetical protein